jgi:hypothetical protein
MDRWTGAWRDPSPHTSHARLGLRLNETKSRVVDLTQGEAFGFLGFTFRRLRSPRGRWWVQRTPAMKQRTALLRKLKEVFRRWRSQPVRRVIAVINPILRDWVNYFRAGTRHDACDRRRHAPPDPPQAASGSARPQMRYWAPCVPLWRRQLDGGIPASDRRSRCAISIQHDGSGTPAANPAQARAIGECGHQRPSVPPAFRRLWAELRRTEHWGYLVAWRSPESATTTAA